ncbi:MAG: response regulator transcription factor [Myxococcota bacterium]
MTRVLVVDDEPRIREVVQYALEREGFAVETAAEGSQVPSLVAASAPDLIVLDIMLPGIDGLELCRQLRKTSTVPILFLSAKGEEIDRVLGLELGGDDYLTKPFSPRELTARVKAILRRAPGSPGAEPTTEVLAHGGVRVDRERHQVHVGAVEVVLTPTEFGVLSALLERPGVVLSRGQLMQRAYSYDNHVTERTIDTHVRRIRAKFREVGGTDPIATVHGVGYKAGAGEPPTAEP